MNSRNTQRTDILKFRADTSMPRADGHEPPRHECITQRIRGINHYNNYGYVVHPPYVCHHHILCTHAIQLHLQHFASRHNRNTKLRADTLIQSQHANLTLAVEEPAVLDGQVTWMKLLNLTQNSLSLLYCQPSAGTECGTYIPMHAILGIPIYRSDHAAIPSTPTTSHMRSVT